MGYEHDINEKRNKTPKSTSIIVIQFILVVILVIIINPILLPTPSMPSYCSVNPGTNIICCYLSRE